MFNSVKDSCLCMNRFTIEGDEYLPFKNSLFRVGETVESIGEIEDDKFYIHEDSVGKFELPPDYSAFDTIFHPNETSNKKYYTVDETGHLGDEFTSAQELERIVPDNLEECPECGSAAGEKSDESTPKCFTCGYGFDD